MDLSVDFAGIRFRNPVLASAGPLTETYEKIERLIEAGIGGIVVKTIKDEPEKSFPRPRLMAYESRPKKLPLNGLQNIDGYSEHSVETWKSWLIRLKKEYPSIPLIVSITSSDPKKLADLAARVESFGADAIQLDLSCPHHFFLGTGTGSTNPDLTKLYVEAVKKQVKMPVIQKLTYNVADITVIAKASVEAGVDGLVPIDTVRSLIGIDIERGGAGSAGLRWAIWSRNQTACSLWRSQCSQGCEGSAFGQWWNNVVARCGRIYDGWSHDSAALHGGNVGRLWSHQGCRGRNRSVYGGEGVRESERYSRPSLAAPKGDSMGCRE